MSRRYNPYPARNWAQCKDTHCQPRPNLTENCPPDCVQYAIPCTNTCTFEDDCDSSTCPDTENFGNSLWHTTHYTQHFPLMNADAPLGDDLQQQLDLQFDCCANDYYPENECCVPLPITDASGSTSNINLNQYATHQIGLPALFKAHHDSLPLPPPSASGPSFSTAPTPELSPADYFPHPVPSSSAASFACLWSNCGQCFPSLGELVGHVNLAHLRLPADAPTHDHAHGAPACHTAPLFPDTSQTSQQDVLTCLWSDCSLIPAPLDTSGADNASLCEVCGVDFSEAATLQQHMRRHTQEKPYVCDFPGCGKAFAITGALTIHKRTHNGDKPFKCKYCDRAFSESSNLSKHLRTHTGQRPYACPEPGCGKKFSRPDQVTRHRHVHQKKSKEDAKDKDDDDMGADVGIDVGED
ncbi:Zinc finger protein 569 [Rhizoctonia solani AG-1 IB]|uniref:Zinc finger protein 569 n=1 Tax=Thanatephorus cucumeris (strain AG1-IB / isolate 7/3/14) TaxID=1108050 RepID=M5BXJ5_THACB|nr:Zinc finger protein 569 [Rhizoctonia solani AG-1 IB]